MMRRPHEIAFLTLATLSLMIGLVSCSDDKGKPTEEIMLCDLVTLVSTSEADGMTFTFQRYDDSPLITLTAPKQSVDEKYVGQRVLLYYYPESGQAYTSGVIRAHALSSVVNGKADPVSIADCRWDANPVWLYSVWRTGAYLNFRYRIDFTDEPATFCLVADETTLGDTQPQLYLVHDMGDKPANFLREGYASFDISDIWNLPACRSVMVHVNDCNLNKDSYLFTK